MTDEQFLVLLRLAIGHNPDKGTSRGRKWYEFLAPMKVPEKADRRVIQNLVQELSR